MQVVRLLKTCSFGVAGATVSVSDGTATMLSKQRLAVRFTPDGLQVEFVKNCSHGCVGDVRVVSYSTAQALIVRGVARDVSQPKIEVVHTAASIHSVKVTAICPTYNRRRYLSTSVALFLAQTYTNSELLIVDDSIESIADLVPKHPRIRFVRLEKSDRPQILGHDGRMLIGAKRNVCCGLANGEFIVHWDDDDWQAPGRIAHQVALLEAAKKQVMTYCNILYYHELTQVACRCFPRKEMRALHGATFCYKKAWWDKHKFVETGGGEDTAFGLEAMRGNELLIADAQKYMVVRAHGHNDESITDRGNTCRTADHMGTGAIPKTNKDDIPAEFFAPLLESKLPDVLAPEKVDAVIGVIKNYDWPAIRAYALSLSRTGFSGKKLMFVENILPAARAGLIGEGFELIDFVTPPDVRAEENKDYLAFGRHRFKYVIDYLKARPGIFRNIVWCDVRDLIFQKDPAAWLQTGMTAPRQLIAAGEGWLVKNEGYNDRWTKRVSPNDYARLREEEILCSGSFAGDAETMLGVFEAIYAMVLNSRTYFASTLPHTTAVSDNADQGMFNYVARIPYKDVTRAPRMAEGFAATWFPAKSNDPLLIPDYGKPIFNEVDSTVYTPDGVTPFSIVHQYDRDPSWKARIESKYEANSHVQHGGKDVIFCNADPTDGVECFQCRGAWHEIENLTFIQSLALSGSYLDAGAYVGTHSLFFALFCPSDRVYSFEPNPPIYRKLLQNLEANGVATKCMAYNLALSDHEGYGVSQEMPVVNAHINRAASQIAVQSAPSPVRVVTLDSLNIKPRVIKLDAEGAELQILKGATETLKTAEHLFIELWDHAGVALRRAEGFSQCEYIRDATISFLKAAGFTLQPLELINDIYYFKRGVPLA